MDDVTPGALEESASVSSPDANGTGSKAGEATGNKETSPPAALALLR
jgi:hypothetical protein